MRRLVNFTKSRYIMFALSLLLIAAGIGTTLYRGGLNLGIDFMAGLNQRVQIAPVAATVTYNGEAQARMDVSRLAMTITLLQEETGEPEDYRFAFEQYPSLDVLAAAVTGIPGMGFQAEVSGQTSTDLLVGFSYPMEFEDEPIRINFVDTDAAASVSIDQIRETLEGLGAPQIQIVGEAINQEFSIRVLDPGDEADFGSITAAKIQESLGAVFGTENILVKQTDYVGPRFSGELGSQTVSLTIMALLLILVYIWTRFRLAFAVSAIVALLHDVLIMLGFIGAFQVEVVTATVAAVLTIIGYSLNDTIVVFDRVRENQKLLRDSEFTDIINTSITQSLSRTIITSLTTLLAVVALYLFGSGPIKDFALAMIVGIVVGTYSSIFIASPVLLGWTNTIRRRKKAKDTEMYGVKVISKADSEAEAGEPKEAAAAAAGPVKIPVIQRKLKGKRQKKK